MKLLLLGLLWPGCHNSDGFTWCLTPARGNNPDVVYYLHGGGGGPLDWLGHYGAVVDERWGESAPAVVSISLGRYRRLDESEARSLAARLPLGGARRFLVGESMGGYNAYRLAAARPDLFAGAALLCPALPAEAELADALPPLYVSCGREDAFFARAERLARAASASWKPLDGGHCAVDPASLADFLAAP